MFSGMQQTDYSVNNVLAQNSETYIRYVFNRRDQKAHETVDDYISSLCTLALTCNFCDCLKDSLLRDRIVLGVKDSSTRKRLLQEVDLNLETCIAMCRAAEESSTSVASEANIKREFDDSDDSALLWTTEPQKQEPAWSMEEENFPDQPSGVYGSSAQPMFDNASLLALSASHVCEQCCSAFVLVSTLELHLASVHAEKLVLSKPLKSNRSNTVNGNDLDWKTDDPDADDLSESSSLDFEPDRYIRKNTRKNMIASDRDSDEEDQKIRRNKHLCGVCNRSFNRPSKLRAHQLTHSGVKPFVCKNHVCSDCGKSYDRPSKLERHRLMHIGIKLSENKPHICDVCQKAFAKPCLLAKHKAIHCGVKPPECKQHVCDICQKAFGRPSWLWRHRQTHRSACPFKCDECGLGFSQADSLSEHRITHTLQMFKCPHCDSVFNQSDAFQFHMKSAHQGESSVDIRYI